ncbi:MAG TPA: hypothetical protein VHB48_16055 [Chitinophagaceae bacterium]|nr:hypothetical protein [Chitinophagaceae bacterium]
MTHTLNLLIADFYPAYSLLIAGIIGLAAGFFTRLAINAKQKKNILKLENEMLSNHSRILSLEKQISSLEKENFELSKSSLKKAELKVS